MQWPVPVPGPELRALERGRARGREIPRAVLRAWDEAEARLFPTIMARPDLYQQSVSLIQRLLGRLRDTCPTCPPSWRRTNGAAT